MYAFGSSANRAKTTLALQKTLQAIEALKEPRRCSLMMKLEFEKGPHWHSRIEDTRVEQVHIGVAVASSKIVGGTRSVAILGGEPTPGRVE